MESRRRLYIIISSLLLHLLLLFLWEGAIRLKIINFDVTPPSPLEGEPIVFDLQHNLPREVIETPEDAKVVENQKKANFLSDKNALARNPETDLNLDEGKAFARGDFESHDLPAIQGAKGEKQQKPTPDEKVKEDGDSEKNPAAEDNMDEKDATAIYRENRLRSQNPIKPGVKERLPGVTHDHRRTRALDMGGLSFNTYDWDYAPYLLALKERIRRNIFPPTAFTRLGMISGETLLRFKIFPEGELRDLEILGYKGHESLMITSSKAIEISVPFPELPSDFPEPYLEVTGKFIYFVHRTNN